jgi:hypothetical protein
MLPDYYAILGVAPNADRDTIRQAYRKQAIAAHPDCGGSHERMVLVNEAWGILSDSVTRARYDEARQQRHTMEVQQAAAADAATARQHAQSYPQNRRDLDSWLAAVSSDFTGAKYDQVNAGLFSWPTASNSVSAHVFLWGSGLLVLVPLLFVIRWPEVLAGQNVFRNIAPVLVASSGGSWLGYWLHRWIGDRMRPPLRRKYRSKLFESEPSPTSGPETPWPNATPVQGELVIHCPHCTQGLKLPRITQVLAVTCPRCRFAFDLPPSMG